MKLSDYEKVEICEKYKTGKYFLSDLSNKYLVTKNTISNILKKNNIEVVHKLRKNTKAGGKRLYTLDEHYFDIIDTEEKAYFLGLLYADGCNYEKRKLINIALQEEDKEILEKFNIAINSNKPLYQIKKKNENCKIQFKIELASKHMSQQLTKLGCTPRKSLTLIFPTEEQVPFYLIRHFVRGYFDGDGSISYRLHKNKYKKYLVQIISTLDFCNSLQNIIPCLSSICQDNRSLNTSTRILCISGKNQVIKFINWLYTDSSIYLNRKYKSQLGLR